MGFESVDALSIPCDLKVLGCAFLLGGLRHPTQKFSQPGAATQCSLMALILGTNSWLSLPANLEMFVRTEPMKWSLLCVGMPSNCKMLAGIV